MILKSISVGSYGTNCYIFGSDKTKEVVIIDPGADIKKIATVIKSLGLRPIAVLLTHGHKDHSQKAVKIADIYKVPLMFSKREYDLRFFTQKPADRWLKEGDEIKIGELTLHVLETPGHTPGSLSFFSKVIKEFENQVIDGVLFTGDLIFFKRVGAWYYRGGNKDHLYASIKNKIMNNTELSDNFLLLPGHSKASLIGIERESNEHKEMFL
ncbi:MAG: MBL fold metallo-hydrolase [Promethearchaeota archaeon]